ncbi:MAG: hypothetical protein R3E12_11255 [Candidatus Eisenbacteria bacterium]
MTADPLVGLGVTASCIPVRSVAASAIPAGLGGVSQSQALAAVRAHVSERGSAGGRKTGFLVFAAGRTGIDTGRNAGQTIARSPSSTGLRLMLPTPDQPSLHVRVVVNTGSVPEGSET